MNYWLGEKMGIMIGPLETMSFIDLCSFYRRSRFVPYPSEGYPLSRPMEGPLEPSSLFGDSHWAVGSVPPDFSIPRVTCRLNDRIEDIQRVVCREQWKYQRLSYPVCRMGSNSELSVQCRLEPVHGTIK